MSAFIEIINDTGNVLINQNYNNFVLINRQTVKLQTYADPQTVGAYANVSMTVKSGAIPVIAIVLPTDGRTAYASQQRVSGNTHTWTISAPRDMVNKEITYLIFDVATVNVAGTGLVVIYNDQGKPVFDSDAKYMRVSDILTVPYNPNPNTPFTKSVASGREYAVVFTSPSFEYSIQGVDLVGFWWTAINYLVMFPRRNGNTISFKLESYMDSMSYTGVPMDQPYPDQPRWDSTTPGIHLLIDTTYL